MRANITLSDELNNWFDEESAKIGISKSGLMAVALEQYKFQKESMLVLSEVSRIARLEEAKKEGNS